MKKCIYFVAFAAIAAIAFTGCKTPDDVKDEVSVTFAQKTVEIGVDESLRLNAIVTPAGANVSLTYKSTDPSVATVSGSGLLTGVELGEADIIVTAQGSKSDTCHVLVSDMAVYNSFDFAGFVFLSHQGEETEMIEGTDTILEVSIGDVKCQLGYYHFFGYDGNTQWKNGSGWIGDGYTVCFDVPVYIIVDDMKDGTYNGYYISYTGGYYAALPLEEGTTPRRNIGNSGSFDIQTSGEWVQAMYGNDTTLDFDALEAAMWEKNKGAFVGEVYSGRNFYEYGLLAGHVNKFVYYEEYEDSLGNEIPASWAIDLDWASMQNDRMWGFRYDTALYASTYVQGKGGEIELIQPYDYTTVHRVFDEDGIFDDEEEAAAPAVRKAARKQAKYKLGDMSKILIIDEKTKTAVRASELRNFKK